MESSAAATESVGLSRREAQVLGLIARGYENEEIAAQLGVTVNTVKVYIRSAYKKIGVERRSHAVIWGMLHGLGPADWEHVHRRASGA